MESERSLVQVRYPEADTPSGGFGWLKRVQEQMRGQSALLRLPVLGWMFWIMLHHLRDAGYASFLSGINMGIHETGHLLFFWAGAWLYVAGGTIAQLAAPILIGWMFWRQRDYLAVSFTFVWLATNLIGIARYIDDARAQLLPLVSFAPGPTIHDWEYLLNKASLLEYNVLIAQKVRWLGMAVGWIGCALGIGIILLILSNRSSKKQKFIL
ncbi:MAG TPA: hypothetical protein PKL83_02295 [bacterium]|nr:hypothetical protein [bacterium]